MYKEAGKFGDLSKEIQVTTKASAEPDCNYVSNNKAAILSATSSLQRNGNSTSRAKMQHQGLSFPNA
nr:hypothetical protein [Tanacetum cinerariifolium]